MGGSDLDIPEMQNVAKIHFESRMYLGTSRPASQPLVSGAQGIVSFTLYIYMQFWSTLKK